MLATKKKHGPDADMVSPAGWRLDTSVLFIPSFSTRPSQDSSYRMNQNQKEATPKGSDCLLIGPKGDVQNHQKGTTGVLQQGSNLVASLATERGLRATNDGGAQMAGVLHSNSVAFCSPAKSE